MLGILEGRQGHLPVGPGPASPGWGNSQRWRLEGADPSVSLYDQDFGASHASVDRQIRDGILSVREELPPQEPTMTRVGRVSAQQSSLPAARFFQSYASAGTGQNWSAGTAAAVPRGLPINFNPNAQGAAELHPATTYDPFPSPASLYPKVV